MVSRILTIAGSDSSGGAGIEADIKTISSHGCYAMTCITGLTAQNTTGVRQIYPVSDQAMIRNILEAVFDDIGVDAVKTGMLSSRETVETVVSVLTARHTNKPLVVDPVMVSTSGAQLIPSSAIDLYIHQLLPLASLVTPNLLEACFIYAQASGTPFEAADVASVADMATLARNLHEIANHPAILIKGGHGAFLTPSGDLKTQRFNSSGSHVLDILYDGTEIHFILSPRVESTNTHGTGCTLSSAIACNLVSSDLKPAVEKAVHYVAAAIASAPGLGAGFGPLNHLHNTLVQPFSANHFVDYLLDHPKVKPLWPQYIRHPFVAQVAAGTIRQDSFKHFLVQDYLYLLHYARACGMLAYKATVLEDMSDAAKTIDTISHETELHLSYCKQFGVSLAQIEATPESVANISYTRYMLDMGVKEDYLALKVAMLPCLLGYGDAARIGAALPEARPENPYYRWVDTYQNPRFEEYGRTGRELVERKARALSPAQIERLVDIFATTTEMEIRFWDAALAYRE